MVTPVNISPSRSAMPIHILVIGIISAAVFANALYFDFVWDDMPFIKEASFVKSLANIPGIFSNSVIIGSSYKDALPYYRPLSISSYAFDYFFWNGNPSGFHFTNILLHVIISILVYLIGCKILQSGKAALFAGLIFSVHPVHSESVAYISARHDMLSAFFLLLSLYFYIHYREKPAALYFLLSCILFFCALLSKEMPIVFSAVIFLYELAVMKRGLKKALVASIPFLLTTVLYLVIRKMVLTRGTWESPYLAERLYTGLGITVDYIRLLLFPVDMKVLYDIPIKWSLFQHEVLISLLGILVMIVVLVILRRQEHKSFFALLWMLLMLFPVSGIPVFLQPALMAERYLYMPSIGFSLAAGVLLTRVPDKIRGASSLSDKVTGAYLPKAVFLLFLLAILVLSIATFIRNYNWKNDYFFCKRMITDAPGHPLGYYNMGLYFERRYQYLEANLEFQTALVLTLKRTYAQGMGYLRHGQYEKARRELEQLYSVGNNGSDVYNNLGISSFYQSRIPEAMGHFQKAIDLSEQYRQKLLREFPKDRTKPFGVSEDVPFIAVST